MGQTRGSFDKVPDVYAGWSAYPGGRPTSQTDRRLFHGARSSEYQHWESMLLRPDFVIPVRRSSQSATLLLAKQNGKHDVPRLLRDDPCPEHES